MCEGIHAHVFHTQRDPHPSNCCRSCHQLTDPSPEIQLHTLSLIKSCPFYTAGAAPTPVEQRPGGGGGQGITMGQGELETVPSMMSTLVPPQVQGDAPACALPTSLTHALKADVRRLVTISIRVKAATKADMHRMTSPSGEGHAAPWTCSAWQGDAHMAVCCMVVRNSGMWPHNVLQRASVLVGCGRLSGCLPPATTPSCHHSRGVFPSLNPSPHAGVLPVPGLDGGHTRRRPGLG